ncbi:MAG: YebC/PmpR family DNA-binding transcriptional regulator [Candidatus Cloacimonadota bacterium]|nr:MAG: YebC/PmpR family DNA-binding transcriptional regulator [Candidatus Cloacimonadota bacterium]PIE78311.1 MAG: YebC/PmpR family DNA-binding transcriptional regulator [Candidatus Delongbacteria bacterium]
MSGHSKWATIKRKKAKTDAARGKVFTKLIKEITVAARLGGGEEDANPRLKVAIQKAKAANMPNDNIEKARKKGAGELEGVNYEEISYEGYGPGGIAVFVEAMTDNKVRTVSEVRHAFAKNGGNLGENGSVGWMFHKRGLIIINAEGLDEEEVMEYSLELGAEDFKSEDDNFEIYTTFEDYIAISEAMSEKFGEAVLSSELTMLPDNYTKLASDKVKSFMKMIDMLEDSDDVQDVYHNAEIDDADMENL